MKESSIYSLNELPKWYPLRKYRRRLVGPGGASVTVVNGDDIGLQIDLGNFTLIATSYDYFDGCEHWLYLLRNGELVDQLRMPDELGFIQELSNISEDEVAFGYFGTNDKWNLRVFESGFWSYSASSLLRRPNRFFLSKRHILISRTKGPSWHPKESAPNHSLQPTQAGCAGRSAEFKRYTATFLRER